MIPLVIWLYIYAIVAGIALVIAWFAIVITGHYPRGLYDFVAGYTRFLTRATAYGALLCDPYPSFGGSADPAYPIRMEFEPLDHYSRLKTLLPHHPRDPDRDPALRHRPAAGDRRVRGLVRDPLHRQDAARPLRPDGVRQLLHRALGRLPLPADRDLSSVPGRADPRGRRAHGPSIRQPRRGTSSGLFRLRPG